MNPADKYAEIKKMRMERDIANTREFYVKLLNKHINSIEQ